MATKYTFAISGSVPNKNASPQVFLPERPRAICKMLREMLEADFLEDRLRLQVETDNRCRSIDVNQDFYYIDDWADE
jgi:hypothetical protein